MLAHFVMENYFYLVKKEKKELKQFILCCVAHHNNSNLKYNHNSCQNSLLNIFFIAHNTKGKIKMAAVCFTFFITWF